MPRKTRAFFSPFDLFGSGGTGAGAQLLADAFREMLQDNQQEKIPTRARAYANQVKVKEFSFPTLSAYQAWQRQARQAIRPIFRKGEFLIWVTGNHLGALPVYQELAGQKNRTLVIQFDAHLDIYNLTDCTAELSHGNFLLHCQGPLPDLINVGHRELLLRPAYVRKYYRQTFPAATLALDPAAVLAAVAEACAQADQVFLDLDCDVFDLAYFPAQAHPLPFGLSPLLFLKFLDAIGTDRLLGLAVSEFAPDRDQGDRSLATLLWLLEYLLLKLYE